jgi:hypothetical protein
LNDNLISTDEAASVLAEVFMDVELQGLVETENMIGLIRAVVAGYQRLALRQMMEGND